MIEISKMIEAVVHEVEYFVQTTQNRTSPAADMHVGANNTPSTQCTTPPVHFRVYRSAAGAAPSGGSVPFVPGSLGGRLGSDSDEEPEIEALEHRLRTASVPLEVEEVCSAKSDPSMQA